MFFFFFKQKTAYEMLRSLVGSEMCIRDSCNTCLAWSFGRCAMEERGPNCPWKDLPNSSFPSFAALFIRPQYGAIFLNPSSLATSIAPHSAVCWKKITAST
eukprot:TRINITY_DN14519_c0_g1_i2.p3 TRINITY_DN14519_c0_g1~~TRINITY_DN14519_c0_g1_i2.p3  ORF type:complete len:101 (+),score=23.70 TRINITY_DN14519_c0_g1_i2:91-393(+)